MNTRKKPPQDGYVRTALRVPPDLHQAIHEAARQSERTFNGQIVATLRAALVKKAEGATP